MKNFVRLAAILLLFAFSAQAATYTVNSNADTDDGTCDVTNCTLREAISAVNAAPGGTIAFAISGSTTITLTSALPDITAPVVLDATTQPTYVGAPVVQLDGISTATNCLVLRAGDSVIRGLDIGKCADGIAVISDTGALSNVAIERNFIGTRMSVFPINGRAIALVTTGAGTLSNVTVGNGTPGGRNVLATYGFVVDTLAIGGNVSDVTVAGNYFGIDESGTSLVTAARFTTDVGIYGSASSSGIMIGGSTPGARNVFSSGGGTQVNFKIDSLGSNLTIEGNYIGTDPTGTIRKGATNFAVWFFGQGSGTIRNNVMATNGGNVISRGVTTTGPVVVQGNWINVKADGSGAFPLVLSSAINDFSSAPGYTIGGPNPGDGNVIANYHTGVFVSSPGALVQGNLIGLDPTGSTILGSGTRGIFTSFARTEPGVFFRDNRIAGFTTGIEVGNEALATVDGNFIGTDATGTLARPNTTGLSVSGAAGRAIITNNVIAGNTGNGAVLSPTTMPVTMTGNRIGVNAGGGALPNGGDGIRITSGTALKRIGTLTDPPNTIAWNGGIGVNVAGGTQTAITHNSIFSNGSLAIDLGNDGVTANDLNDADTGANNLQNAPVLLSAVNGGGATNLQGTFHSAPGTTYAIELFTNTAADASTFGEAETFLTRVVVVTDGAGNAPISLSLAQLPAGTILTANATDLAAANTSEMSNAIAVSDGGVIQFAVAASSVNESAGTATITVTRTGGTSPASVLYASSNGTASAADYTAVTGTLNFGAADTSQTFTVPITPDAIDEADETLTLTLSGFTGGSPGTPITMTLTITDDDAPPTISVSDASVSEGNSGTTSMTFDVSLSAASEQQITIDYTTADVMATAGSDYGARFGTLTFAPGETLKSVSVTVNGDITAEANETLELLLSSPVNATVLDGTGTGTINNDDGDPSIAITDATVIEGASGPTAVSITVTLSNPSSSTVTVNYATAANTATSSDFTPSTGTITFNPGVTAQTVPIDVLGDTLVEGNENFLVDLTSPANATIGDAQSAVTIVDDDGSPALTVSDVAIDESSGVATLTVLLAPASAQTVTASWNTADATASSPGDYTTSSSGITFNPGETSATITVPIVNDSMTEAAETFSVTLAAPSNAGIADGTATVTIVDDDPTPVLSVGDLSVVEGASASFNVTLSNPSATTVTVNYATVAGIATAADFSTAASTLTFNPGEVAKTVAVATTADTLQEPAETFVFTLSGATNATITRPEATATIVDDDGTPSILVSDVSVAEGDAGTASASFVVTIAGNAAQTIAVDFVTANGTATAGSDYAATSGHLLFPPGTTTQTIDVPVIGDASVETDETFFVNLTNPSNATIADNQALGTITNDDTAAVVPSISIADTGVTEGNAGTASASFVVTLSAPTTSAVTVDYATANAGATAGNDYAATSGTLLFAPGVTSRTIVVAVAGDTLVEGNETFVVNLTNPASATLLDAQATGTIVDDDSAPVVPSIAIGDASVVEGDSGTGTASFNVTLSAPTTIPVTIDYATVNGSATAASDYAAVSGTLVFAPGITSRTVIVAVAGDTLVEGNETFVVNLTNVSGATLADPQAIGTIVDDDTASSTPSISIQGARVTEGDGGTRNAVFAVRLSESSGAPVTVDFSTQNGTAIAGSDFVSATGSVVFAPGATNRSISIVILGDTDVEPDETFRVHLSNATGGVIAGAQANGVIVNDDQPASLPTMSIAPATIVEGDTGAKTMSFDVTLSHATTAAVTVSFATSDDTATAGPDYVFAADTLAFAPGETSRTINVTILGDRIVERDETFHVTLTAPVGATLATDHATGTIQDDDGNATGAVFVIAGSGAGNGGAFFRTQLQLHNPDDDAMRGELVFRPMDGSASKTFGYALDPRETRDVGYLLEGGFVSIDVVPQEGPLPVGTMRVFNDGGTNGAPGLLAPLVDVADALRAGDHAVLITPADAEGMRYNIGIRSLDAGAALLLTLRRASGDPVGTANRELAPNSLVQISATSLFGTTLENNDTIEITVAHGSVIVYGSAVENTSQDPSMIFAKRY